MRQTSLQMPPRGRERAVKEGPSRGETAQNFKVSFRSGRSIAHACDTNLTTFDFPSSQIGPGIATQAMLDGPTLDARRVALAPFRRPSPTGPLSVNLPAAVEPVRGAEIHLSPPCGALGSPLTIASVALRRGYSTVNTVAVPRRLVQAWDRARHAGCEPPRAAAENAPRIRALGAV